MNLSIPDDLQIVGYNNLNLTLYCEPELSSIDNKLGFCCVSATNIIMNTLKGKSVPNNTLVSGELILRDSTQNI